MKGDFSRLTFDRKKHFSAVLMQQGRVQLDADWNEQVQILGYEMSTRLKDLVGASAGPVGADGFAVSIDREENRTAAEGGPGQPVERREDKEHSKPGERLPDFWIGAGRYYVDGILVENDARVSFTRQPNAPGAEALERRRHERQCLVYLDVWERHVTAIEEPEIREVALGGPDTTTRLQTAWQVSLLPVRRDEEEGEGETGDGEQDAAPDAERGPWRDAWGDFLEAQHSEAMLRARRGQHYTALENKLYRVEIQQVDERGASFKWSRENGSVAFPIRSLAVTSGHQKAELKLADQERDPLALKTGDWVELSSDASQPVSAGLCQVEAIDASQETLILQCPGGFVDKAVFDPAQHPLLRRWDQNLQANPSLSAGQVPIVEGQWIPLENGIEVSFSFGGQYRPGDYWLIPVRSLTGDIEWPRNGSGPVELPPHGVAHHYAPLALLELTGEGWRARHDFRRVFVPAPVLDAEDLAIFKRLKMERMEFEAIQLELAALAEEVAALRKEVGSRRENLLQEARSIDLLAPGDVVAVDHEHPHRVVHASAHNEALVLGVVSQVNSVASDGEFAATVITYGRARCRVRGEIHPGNSLAPSETAGYAHRAGKLASPGTLIGKALGHFEPEDEDDTGEIEIFVVLA